MEEVTCSRCKNCNSWIPKEEPKHKLDEMIGRILNSDICPPEDWKGFHYELKKLRYESIKYGNVLPTLNVKKALEGAGHEDWITED